jgi:outer membrane protein W
MVGAGIGLASFGYNRVMNEGNAFGYNVSLNPGAGYMLTDHWLISGELLAGFQGSSARNSYNTQSAGIGLGVRYYFASPTNANAEVRRLRLYAETGASYGRNWSADNLNGSRYTTTGYQFQLKGGLGFNYLLNENVAFESGISGRRWIAGDRGSFNSISTLVLDLGVRIFLGHR